MNPILQLMLMAQYDLVTKQYGFTDEDRNAIKAMCDRNNININTKAIKGAWQFLSNAKR